MWDEFVRELDAGSPDATRTALETLQVYANNIAQNGSAEKYRRINTRNEKFLERVWQHNDARTILFAAGWEEGDDGFLTLPEAVSSEIMRELAHVIERHIKQKYGPPKVVKPVKAVEDMTKEERERHERDERNKEERRKILEAAAEDKRKREALKAQIEADRQANAMRHSGPSVARSKPFGSGCKSSFKDIGVDLNKGG